MLLAVLAMVLPSVMEVTLVTLLILSVRILPIVGETQETLAALVVLARVL